MAEKSSKRYNIPSSVTEEVRRRERAKRAREDAERTSDSSIPESDKMALKKMIEEEKDEGEYEEGFMKGGAVRKYAEGGLVRSSVRGGGIALRGLGKGKVY